MEKRLKYFLYSLGCPGGLWRGLAHQPNRLPLLGTLSISYILLPLYPLSQTSSAGCEETQ